MRKLLLVYLVILLFPATFLSAETFKGYLVDLKCWTNGKGMDGTDIRTKPQDHSLHCLQFCQKAGFGVAFKKGKIFVIYQFDDEGNELAIKNILNKSKKEKGISIQVTGTRKRNTIKVTSIKEISKL
ncbi:MAG: hypothetical protein JW969_15650 [Spirochaetales bacterium]|nr:hypothetical protein [Spirochaetales bacterium]